MFKKNSKILTNNLDIITSILLVIICVVIILVIRQLDYSSYSKGRTGSTITYEKCRVLNVIEENLKKSNLSEKILVGKQNLQIYLLSGKYKGETLTASNRLSVYNSVLAKKGQKLTVIVDELKNGKFKVRVYNYDRAPYIYIFALIFLFTMVLISGKKGLMSCLSLVYTLVSILFIFLPLIMRGYSPVWSSIGVVVLVTTANMVFLNGISKKTFCAISGTASGVVLSGLILLLYSSLVHISGFKLEEAESLLFIRQKTSLGVENILFAGILIAAMGAVMDTALSIVSAIYELHVNVQNCGAMKLFKTGMNVGKDMIGTMSNTLILAFVGSALSTIIVLDFYSVQYNHLINSNFVAIEIVQALAGSMGVILTIPITAALTARLLQRESWSEQQKRNSNISLNGTEKSTSQGDEQK
ncbi:Uncharacterized membrane protein [Desulfuromusa kysingii]|uniref:Uncharacterized membrane protein n=1 Tax=Desulfuromusa kysingii TaxID=37625 RepID=A0A1H3ZYX3_9BACT|nr:YibE/F family protein [Desulfuromusa kysingii]SEA29083.1 Uncharacterized membrane protein [Desulfuromusa kysingii]